jgi:hypothetical protein
MRYELAEYEWIAIKPMLPNKPRADGFERVRISACASTRASLMLLSRGR